MFQTSKDILFIALGIAILAISFFLCFFLYYLIRLVKEFYEAGRSIKKTFLRIDGISKNLKEKLKEFTLIPLLSEAIKAFIGFLKEKQRKKEEKE